MADEKQEDMSMEEILSSIKGILTEDNAPAETTAEPAASSSLAAEPEKEDVLGLGADNIEVDDLPFSTEEADDILDLTPDMRVGSQNEAEVTVSESEALEPETIDLGKELEDVEVDMGTPQLDSEIDPALPDLDPMPDFAMVDESLVVSEPEDSDPIYIPEEDSTPLYDELSEPMAETEVIHETEVEAIEEPTPAAPVFQPSENSWIDQEAETSSQDAADVSADIINNFAKIFAQSKDVAAAESPAAAQPAQAPAAVTHDLPLGNAGQTLSETVKEVIRDIISGWVMENLNTQMDLNSIAQELVAEQVKSWLSVNLPGMVESVVKKEIERVMAKAGKN